MAKIKGAFNCSYCHGDVDHACSFCDWECNCLEILAHDCGECSFDCEFCEAEAEKEEKKEN